METIFTKIIKGEIPCYKIDENEQFIAFLDISPLAKGHTLVVPKQQIDYIFDIDDDTLAAMTLYAKKIAKAIQKTVPCERIGVAVIGLEVPHTHIHLVPISHVGDLNFQNPRVELTKEEFMAIAEGIAQNLEK
ncbi:MAG: HIT domain-containing protein [Bacteroidales bacterium]|nr:HIT domain-containing protein [Bacteroidales bacterium]